jgi:uncharacterized protein (TIGR02678 family)
MTLNSQASTSASNPEVTAERQQVLRTLLRNPLLPAVGETAKDYVLVRRHSAWLKQWLTKFPAWGLHVDKEVARLHKTPSDFSDETRPAVDRTSGSSFSRRRYALFCLALGALQRSERQTTLGKIAESIMEFVAADPALQEAGLVFDISNHDQRRDLVHAVRLLLDIGLLRRIYGDEQEFLNRTGASDALYDINRSTLAVMLNVGRSPSAIEAAAQVMKRDSIQRQIRTVEDHAAKIINDPVPATEEARNRRIRARLVRTLLDDPIVYFSELSHEERAYLQRQRGYLLRQIREATGLIPEVRREGIAMVDDSGNLTDLNLPEEGTDGHVGLLLAEWLAGHARNEPGAAIPVSEIEHRVGELIRTHGSRWRKAVREPGAETRVTEETLLRLRGLRLVRMTKEGVVPLAATGRYAMGKRIEETPDERSECKPDRAQPSFEE